MLDNRQQPRFEVDLDCLLTVGGERVVARSKDLSRSGLCCVAPTAVDVSSVVALELVLAFDEGARSEPLHLAAVVVWCTRVGDAFQLGLKFEQPSPEVLGYLDVFIQYVEGQV